MNAHWLDPETKSNTDTQHVPLTRSAFLRDIQAKIPPFPSSLTNTVHIDGENSAGGSIHCPTATATTQQLYAARQL